MTRFCALALVLLLAGCLTLADVPRYKSEGRPETYPVTVDEAWTIARAVFRWGGADVIEDHRAEGYMLTTVGANLSRRGTLMGAWVEPIDATHSRITVVMKRPMQTSVFITMTEAKFHQRFAESVDRLRAERPLQKPGP